MDTIFIKCMIKRMRRKGEDFIPTAEETKVDQEIEGRQTSTTVKEADKMLMSSSWWSLIKDDNTSLNFKFHQQGLIV